MDHTPTNDPKTRPEEAATDGNPEMVTPCACLMGNDKVGCGGCVTNAAVVGGVSVVGYAAAEGADDWDECMKLAAREGHSQVKYFLEQCKEQQLSKN